MLTACAFARWLGTIIQLVRGKSIFNGLAYWAQSMIFVRSPAWPLSTMARYSEIIALTVLKSPSVLSILPSRISRLQKQHQKTDPPPPVENQVEIWSPKSRVESGTPRLGPCWGVRRC
jgi:hypothetical protein